MAQTVGIVPGVDIIITAGGVQISHLTNVTLTTEKGTIDVTTQQSSKQADHLTDTKSWSLTGDVFLDYGAAGEGFDEIQASFDNDTLETIVFGTGVTGDRSQTGTGHYTGVTQSAGVGSAASMSIAFKGTGALTLATIS